jgi:hypothetical protein
MKKGSIFAIRQGLNYWILMAAVQSLTAIFFGILVAIAIINKLWLLSIFEIFLFVSFALGSIHYWRKYFSKKKKDSGRCDSLPGD